MTEERRKGEAEEGRKERKGRRKGEGGREEDWRKGRRGGMEEKRKGETD